MRILKIYIFLAIAFIISGCTCTSCESIDTSISTSSKTQTTSQQVTIYGDACSLSTGAVDNSGVPTANCDTAGGYVNRGRWVKVPNISVVQNSELSLSVEGSMYYCSTGYDNQTASPTFVVYPNQSAKDLFSDGSQMPVVGDQVVLVTTASDDVTGVATSSSVRNACNNNEYSKLTSGACRGYNALGLTIYVGNTEITTLDNDNSAGSTYAPIARARNPYLFSYIISNSLSSFFTNVKSKYNTKLNNYGDGIYAFKVPTGMSGTLGFAIAKGNSSLKNGQYTLQVMSTPPACYVNQAQSNTQMGDRGALQLLVTSSNPNDIDNAISAFNSLNSNEISAYYPALVKYISSNSGVSISSNVSALTSLVIDSSLSLAPIIIKTPSYTVDTSNLAGNVWLKVRDDYYSDNVGQYSVKVKYTYQVNGVVSNFLNNLITPITELFDQLSQQVYANFASSKFTKIVRLCLTLYLIIFGIEFALGLTQVSAQDLVSRVFKMAIVIQLLGPSSWSFFDAYFFEIFKSGRETLIQYITGDYTANKSGIFSFVDDIFNIFFSKATWIVIGSLMFELIGILYMSAILVLMCVYIIVLAKAIVAYLLVVVGISILVSLAPIFIVLILFEHTRKYFDGWLKYLVDYALQPVIMFGALYILNSIFIQFWTNLMSMPICWGSVLTLKIPLSSWTQGFIGDFDLGCLLWHFPKNGVSALSFFAGIFVLYTLSFAIKGLLSAVPDITRAITGVESASTIDQKAGETVQKGMDTGMKVAQKTASTIKGVANFITSFTNGGAKNESKDPEEELKSKARASVKDIKGKMGFEEKKETKDSDSK